MPKARKADLSYTRYNQPGTKYISGKTRSNSSALLNFPEMAQISFEIDEYIALHCKYRIFSFAGKFQLKCLHSSK